MARTITADQDATPESVSERVVAEVAEVTGSDRVDLQPLYDVVDPDALDTLFEQGRFGGARAPTRVSFRYAGCDVVVSTGGRVTVSRAE